mgnify:CR=1 FL=1
MLLARKLSTSFSLKYFLLTLIITLLVMLGYFKKDDQDFLNYLNTPIYNWSEKKTGVIRASDMVWAKGNFLDI